MNLFVQLGIHFLGVLILILSLILAINFRSDNSRKIPHLECIREIDFGMCQYGQQVEKHFTIVNSGDSDLVIESIHTSSSCSGIGVFNKDAYQKVESLTVSARKTVNARIRLMVRGEVGKADSYQVTMKTNDPINPVVELKLKIAMVQGIRVVPSPVIFSNVLLHKQEKQEIQLQSYGSVGLEIKSIRTSHPEILQVQQIITQPSLQLDDFQENQKTNVQIQVIASSHQSQDINGYIEIVAEQKGMPLQIQVPVQARFVKAITISPSTVALPRRSSNNWIYEASVVVKSIKSIPFRLKWPKTEPGIQIENLHANDLSSTYLLYIRVDPKKINLRTDQETTITLSLEGIIENQIVFVPQEIQFLTIKD